VAKMLEFLAKSDVSHQKIFDLSSGPMPDPPVVFCFHFIFMARTLANHLGKRAQVFAVESHIKEEYDLWQKTGKSNTTIKNLAKRCVEDLQRVRPHGPYYLLGFCFGGNLAAEVASQLIQKGEKVAVLALLNSYNHSAMKPQSQPRLARWVYHTEQVSTLGWPYASAKLNTWLEKRRNGRSHSGSQSSFEDNYDTDESRAIQSDFTRALLGSHIYQPFSAKTVLFRAVTDPSPLKWQYSPSHGWKDVVSENLILDHVYCGHADLMKESQIVEVAEKLASYFPTR
jgi:thioesterase domain-containing protein